MKYDYLIIGSGLFGSVFAHEMTKAGKSCRECKIVCVNRYCMNLLYAPYWGKQR